jgi:hypothetical protein
MFEQGVHFQEGRFPPNVNRLLAFNHNFNIKIQSSVFTTKLVLTDRKYFMWTIRNVRKIEYNVNAHKIEVNFMAAASQQFNCFTPHTSYRNC